LEVFELFDKHLCVVDDGVGMVLAKGLTGAGSVGDFICLPPV